jgi:lipoprotein-anchoring transpeptidase ErfK/SrfK
MARMLRTLTRMTAAAVALSLACSAAARADADAGSAYIPDAGSAYIPNPGPAYVPDAGSAYIPNPGPAYVPDAGSAYSPNPGPATIPDAAPAPPRPVRSAYIYVSKQSPERLYLIDGGKVVFESPVNTGIRVSPTPDGVFRVFASYTQRTMKGTDPRTLRPYSDANVPYAMYFDGGRAIHGFPRSGYGYPQSFGCVELPVSKARELFQRLQGGMDTKVVVASQPPALEHGRIASSQGSGQGGGRRPLVAASEGQPPSYQPSSYQPSSYRPSYHDDVTMAAGSPLLRP